MKNFALERWKIPNVEECREARLCKFSLSVTEPFTSLLIADEIKGLIHILYFLITISVYCN